MEYAIVAVIIVAALGVAVYKVAYRPSCGCGCGCKGLKKDGKKDCRDPLADI
ncbi:MAG: FeoB-associated Cys-rich membrane protein [Deltaproteobacteria bacterium]|nr:FeoB-associated Cys-rich membrane protein [Deltaproteobacteria bacterium]